MYNLVHFLALSHTIFFSCAYRPNRGEGSQHQPHKCQVDGTQRHGVVVLHRSVVCSAAPCQESWTSPITWTHRACNRLLGSVQPLLRRPGLQSNSKVPVINTHIVSVTKSLNMNVRNVSRLDVFINELWIMRNLLWTIMNFLNCYEVIELWTYSVSDEVTEHEREEREQTWCFYQILIELLWTLWTIMKLLKLLNYDEVIEVIELWWSYWSYWTMNL